MSLLEKYTELAKHKSDASLANAVKDIKACWAANPDFEDIDGPHADYAIKLWAEWDAYIVEMASRAAAEYKRQTKGNA